MKAEEFYKNPDNWGNPNWCRDKPNTFTVSEMLDFAEQYAELRIQQEREKWKEETKQEVLGALQKVMFNIETSDQYYLKTVKRYDYTLGFNKAKILVVQQINELSQTKNRN